MSHPLRVSDPRRIGAYAVESWLGEGGMGVVYSPATRRARRSP
jgi:hypothetical protein